MTTSQPHQATVINSLNHQTTVTTRMGSRHTRHQKLNTVPNQVSAMYLTYQEVQLSQVYQQRSVSMEHLSKSPTRETTHL